MGSEMGVAQLLAHKMFSCTILDFDKLENATLTLDNLLLEPEKIVLCSTRKHVKG